MRRHGWWFRVWLGAWLGVGLAGVPGSGLALPLASNAAVTLITEEWPPYNYVERGRLTGVSVKIVQALQQELDAFRAAHQDASLALQARVQQSEEERAIWETMAAEAETAKHELARRLEAIQHVEHHRLQRFEQGYLLRGLDIEVTLDSNGFTGEGDIHLFGEMLNRFFALYADMNQFNQLTLIVQPEGKCIRWKENHSPRLPG